MLRSQVSYVRLEAGDIIVVPGGPRYYARDDIAFYLGIVTTLGFSYGINFKHYLV